MKNMVKDGKSVSHTALSDILSGEPVVLGNRIGIANQDISTGKQGELDLEGVFELTSDTGTAYSKGDILYWNASSENLTKTAAGNIFAGECHEDKGSAATSAKVKLSEARQKAAVVAALGLDASATYVEAEVQSIADKVDAVIAALKAAGLMSNS